MLKRCSQRTFPVSALKHITRSCSDSPLPAAFCRYTRSPMTIGAERPPYGAFQARFSPAGDHLEGSPFSREIPSRAGPRHSAQSLPKASDARNKHRARFKTQSNLVILDFHHKSKAKKVR